MNYYLNELKRLENSEYHKSIVITDGQGNQTKHLGINLESIPVLIAYRLYG